MAIQRQSRNTYVGSFGSWPLNAVRQTSKRRNASKRVLKHKRIEEVQCMKMEGGTHKHTFQRWRSLMTQLANYPLAIRTRIKRFPLRTVLFRAPYLRVALFRARLSVGNWVQSEPTGCATTCGVGAGLSGTPGAVTCTTSSCDPDAEPELKECPQTEDCGV